MTRLVGCLARMACRRSATLTPAAGSCTRMLAGARAAATTVVRGPDTPVPGRHPDVYPPCFPRNPTPQDPGNPDPDLYPPDQGLPRRDPGDLPQRFPSPDVYPLPDTPEMPEPPVPGKGPFMACQAVVPDAAAVMGR
ncbi:hypothetical protein D9Q98_007603 [Chlorella vulgaris]|uniref:Uncharacterized protein n=1 Tax=Chlorella vulgaris TaxID=3077 RepID=A0A9D4TLI3_CHLVU|nr:hypothetical protein D9Q98_007603 [Chlorella vulgaris]